MTSPLGAGVVLAERSDRRRVAVAALSVPSDSRSPVLRVTATTPRLPARRPAATPSGDLHLGAAEPRQRAGPIELTIELALLGAAAVSAPIAKPGHARDRDRATRPPPARRGPRQRRSRSARALDGRAAGRRASACALPSANGTSFFDAELDLRGRRGAQGRDRRAAAAALHGSGATGSDHEVRRGSPQPGCCGRRALHHREPSGRRPRSARSSIAAAPTDWRLPEIDELAFVLERRHLASRPAPLSHGALRLLPVELDRAVGAGSPSTSTAVTSTAAAPTRAASARSASAAPPTRSIRCWCRRAITTACRAAGASARETDCSAALQRLRTRRAGPDHRAEVAAGEQVQVEMRHVLMGVGLRCWRARDSRLRWRPTSRAARPAVRTQSTISSSEARRRRRRSPVRTFGNDQDVHRRLRAHVVERERVLGLEHLAARDLAADDPREHVVGVVGHRRGLLVVLTIRARPRDA